MIRVLVADDQALVRGSFCLLVDTAPDLQVIGEAATGAEAVQIATREKPDVLLMDIRMPVMDGIEATQRITQSGQTAGVRVLILTTFDLDDYVYGALRAGASGFLLKDTPPADLLTAIRVIAAGDALLAPAVTRRLIAEFTRRPQPGQHPVTALDGVTDREREVLTLIGRGLSNAEIAGALHVTMTPPRLISAGCWPNSAPATAHNWSSSPTKPASSSQPDPPARPGPGQGGDICASCAPPWHVEADWPSLSWPASAPLAVTTRPAHTLPAQRLTSHPRLSGRYPKPWPLLRPAGLPEPRAERDLRPPPPALVGVTTG